MTTADQRHVVVETEAHARQERKGCITKADLHMYIYICVRCIVCIHVNDQQKSHWLQIMMNDDLIISEYNEQELIIIIKEEEEEEEEEGERKSETTSSTLT